MPTYVQLTNFSPAGCKATSMVVSDLVVNFRQRNYVSAVSSSGRSTMIDTSHMAGRRQEKKVLLRLAARHRFAETSHDALREQSNSLNLAG